MKNLVENKDMSQVPMPKYKCHKVVHAIPIALGDYNKARGWKIPDTEDPLAEGYLVVYNRGTQDEHVSWSPKHIFDDGYTIDKSGDDQSGSPILRYFAYKHLPEHLQKVSKPLGELAVLMDSVLPDGAEKSAGLRKLLEAKDCFVRASV
ncbi:hypothetical protein [Vibrio owensii]|uniref:hypothetical protein n=1 Tax=Vibrio owensii TaxID=696485 RepID=UPI003CE51726